MEQRQTDTQAAERDLTDGAIFAAWDLEEHRMGEKTLQDNHVIAVSIDGFIEVTAREYVENDPDYIYVPASDYWHWDASDEPVTAQDVRDYVQDAILNCDNFPATPERIAKLAAEKIADQREEA